jgi:hypothetical protein
VHVGTLTGFVKEIGPVHEDMYIYELCDMVAAAFEIPNFVVRLMLDERIFHMSMFDATLGRVGIVDGTQLTLVKNLGWARPDVSMLGELEKKWRGAELGLAGE